MKNGKAGFLMSLEAAFSLTLLLIAATALPAFSQPENTAPEFFLCSDAALALVKGGSFADSSLQANLTDRHSLSGTCVSAEGRFSRGCSSPRPQSGKTAITVPFYRAGAVGKATIYCWHEN